MWVKYAAGLWPSLTSDSVRAVDVATIAQVVTAVTNTLFVIVLAAGYYYTWKSSHGTLREMQKQRTTF